ncbi:MAG: hypothetical protein CMJ83_18225 [Planctomycetes bacterium]|nr:hypothetical protein [Planctomycetota bacterium]
MSSVRTLRPIRSLASALAIAVVCLLLTAPLVAHVVLDCPNGGVVLIAGTTYTIVWHVQIGHNTQNWDLWYSTTGPNGPWIPIVMDLPAGNTSSGAVHSYVWTVPAAFSSQVRIRVRQDNSGQDYEDISNGDNSIVMSPLSASPATMSVATGGTQMFTLSAGPSYGDLGYLLAGSASGTSPATSIGNGITIPLVQDAWTSFSIALPNPLYQDTFGVLDLNGQATASFTLPSGLPPSLIGLSVWHAFAVATTTQVVLGSNAVEMVFTP